MDRGRRGARTAGLGRRRQTGLARDFRRNQTPEEALLWEQLRGRRCGGLKFRRQHPIGMFIVDFYCAEARLVVELDGPVHESQRADDADRSAYLESHGLTVIRVSNDEVHVRLPSVLRRIDEAAGVDLGH